MVVSAVNSPRLTPSSSSALNSPLVPTLVIKRLCSPTAATGSTSESAHSCPACNGSGGRVWKGSVNGTTRHAMYASTRTNTHRPHRARRKRIRIGQDGGRASGLCEMSRDGGLFFLCAKQLRRTSLVLRTHPPLPSGCLSTIRNGCRPVTAKTKRTTFALLVRASCRPCSYRPRRIVSSVRFSAKSSSSTPRQRIGKSTPRASHIKYLRV